MSNRPEFRWRRGRDAAGQFQLDAVTDLYEHLDSVRDHLQEIGEEAWARRLSSAERSGSTSGEVLSKVMAVLLEIRRSGLDP